MKTHRPLDGIRVIEWTQWQQGPLAGMMLADLGADVIKVEDPVSGDPSRGVERAGGVDAFPSGHNAYFEGNNRNKRGITLNLKHPQGKEILFKLVENADVFLHNFLPKVADRLGVDYETLRSVNTRLVYAAASGYGSKGPDANKPAFDYTGLARSGIMSVCGEAEAPPQRIEGGVGDQVGGMMTAYGVVCALLARNSTGTGQRVDTSLIGSLLWLQGNNVSLKVIGGTEYQREIRKKARNPLWSFYCCSDGKWLTIAHPNSDRYWPNLCRVLGIEHIQNDARFVDAHARRANSAALVATMDEIFASKARCEWLKALEENGCIGAPVNNFDEMLDDPAVKANDYIVEYDHPAWGLTKMLGFPVAFSETPCALRMPAPQHGQHTEEVLTELLGYDWSEIPALREGGVI